MVLNVKSLGNGAFDIEMCLVYTFVLSMVSTLVLVWVAPCDWIGYFKNKQDLLI